MPRADRTGNRRPRRTGTRVPDLGYYYIVTDTRETEKNYLHGLRDSLPEKLKGRIVIKVESAKTSELISVSKQQAGAGAQYRELWIVLDRDRVVGFDNIIAQAEREGVRVGWSNPCIEIWFDAYFGNMPPDMDSVTCCKNFGAVFEKKTGQEYAKADKNIYSLLNRYGNEEDAIKRAEARLKKHKEDGENTPSKMCPCTTLHHLVGEIRRKASDDTSAR